jgi:replicative DNA helicase
MLEHSEFMSQKHAWIFEAMEALVDRGDAIDLMTLTAELRKRDQLETLGGAAYVSQLISEVPSAMNVAHYADLVHETAVRRLILDDLSATSRDVFDEDLPLEDVLNRYENRVLALRTNGRAGRLRSLPEILATVYENLGDPQAGGAVAMKTGFRDLDVYLGGLRRGALYVVGARTGVGKTAFLLNLAVNAAKQGKNVLFFSLEMSAEALAERLIASEAEVSLTTFDGTIDDGDMVKIADAMGPVSQQTIWVDDTPAITLGEIRSKVKAFMFDRSLDLVIVDYIQIATLGRRVDKRYREIGMVSQGLKKLGREVSVPVVTASQLNRSIENRMDKTPQLSDLRESGNLEQDSDAVLFLTREENAANIAEASVILAKNRNGPSEKTIKLVWNGRKVSFLEPRRAGGAQ